MFLQFSMCHQHYGAFLRVIKGVGSLDINYSKASLYDPVLQKEAVKSWLIFKNKSEIM